MLMTLRQQMLLAHYNQFWGLATSVQRYAFSDAPQDAPFICEFSVGTDEEPLYVCATIGMSDAPMLNDQRVELFVYAREPGDGLRDSLALLATYPFRNAIALAPLDTVYGARSLVDGSRLTSVLLALPTREPEEFAAADLGDGDVVQMLQVVPLTEAERQFASERGAIALLAQFARRGVDLADLQRQGVEGGDAS
jgi:hypothetical protein